MSGLIVSYSSSDGRRAAEALVVSLRERGFDVTWDGDLPVLNPLSIPSWMETEFRERVVVVVASQDYLKALESNDFLDRKGVRYEATLLRHKLYHHDRANSCGVVPVVAPSTDKNSLPAVLQSLVIHCFEPETGAGVEELARSLMSLGAAKGGATMSATPEPTTAASPKVRDLVRELEELDPASHEAYLHARRLVALGHDGIEFARAFESVVTVAKVHGDLDLVRQISEACWQALSSTARLRGEGALEAKILISGRAWYLLREHRFSHAATAAEDGTSIAERFRDPYTAALGTRCQARAYLEMAAEGEAYDRSFYLSKSEHLLIRATERFNAITGGTSEDVGMCASLGAEWALAKYHLTSDRADLVMATDRARTAEGLLTPGSVSYHWLMVLHARLYLAARRYPEGKAYATDVIRSSDYPEVVARAHQVRGDLLLGSRERTAALQDYVVAEEIFRSLGCVYAAAACWWSIARIDSLPITDVRLTSGDVETLELLTDDPRIRRRAVVAHQQATARRFGRRSSPDWRSLVHRVQYE
ncbi:hypothetical protein ACWGE0_38900 [Lentzea sp. NPDC054927]